METVLVGLNWQICLIYLDDIIVIGRTFKNMIQNLDESLQKRGEAGLKLKPRKCQLFAKQVDFLGHVISSQGIQTDPKKTQAVKEWPSLNPSMKCSHSSVSVAITDDLYQSLQKLSHYTN